MGRIKTSQIKRITHTLMSTYGDEFTESFDENKAKVEEFTDIKSAKLRNVIAGYATRLRRKREDI